MQDETVRAGRECPLLIGLALWIMVEMLWSKKSVALDLICIASFVLLSLNFLLEFPPLVDIF